MTPVDPYRCAAFTGHRSCRREADALLMQALERCHAAGITTFLSGMAVGFDLAAAEAVLKLRARNPDVRLIAVLPFREQPLRFPPKERQRFEQILRQADEKVILAETCHKGCYLMRNDYLIAHAATLIAWYDGSPGGTRYTVRRALQCNRRIIHLHPETPRSAAPMPELFNRQI